ncbi:MAG TPA: hypothetical protein VIK08_02660 [Candidatus Limnocylindrales bacterium]
MLLGVPVGEGVGIDAELADALGIWDGDVVAAVVGKVGAGVR